MYYLFLGTLGILYDHLHVIDIICRLGQAYQNGMCRTGDNIIILNAAVIMVTAAVLSLGMVMVMTLAFYPKETIIVVVVADDVVQVTVTTCICCRCQEKDS
jgi:hypothetical protein